MSGSGRLLTSAEGERIREVFAEKGCTAARVAEQLGKDQSTLSRAINGKHPAWPSFYFDLAEVLGVSEEYLAPGSFPDLDHLLKRGAGSVPLDPCERVHLRGEGRDTDLTRERMIGGFTEAIDLAIRLIRGLKPKGEEEARITILGDTKGRAKSDPLRSIRWARALQCAMDKGWIVQHVLYAEPKREWVAHWLLDRLGFRGEYDLLLCESSASSSAGGDEHIATELHGVVVHHEGAFLFMSHNDATRCGRAMYAPYGTDLYLSLHAHAHAALNYASSTIHNEPTEDPLLRLDATVAPSELESEQPVFIVKQGLCLPLEDPTVLNDRAARAIGDRPDLRSKIMRSVENRVRRRSQFMQSPGALKLVTTRAAFEYYLASGSSSKNKDDVLERSPYGLASEEVERGVVLRGYRDLVEQGFVELVFADLVPRPLDSLCSSIHWAITDQRVVFLAFRESPSMHISESSSVVSAMRDVTKEMFRRSKPVDVGEYDRLLRELGVR